MTDVVGSLWKCHYCWHPPLSCGSRQVPPHQFGRKIGQGLGRDDSDCCSLRWVCITLGSVLRVGNATEATSCIKEVPCGDYTYGLAKGSAKGSAACRSLWGRLSQPGVRSGKGTGSLWGEPYRGRIQMWDHPKGNHYIQTHSSAQGLTLGIHTSAGPGVWRSATLECRGWTEGTSTGFAKRNWIEKQ